MAAISAITSVFLVASLLLSTPYIRGESDAADAPHSDSNSVYGTDLPGPVIINTYGGPCESPTTPSDGNKTQPDLSPLQFQVRQLTTRISQLMAYINVITRRNNGDDDDDTPEEPEPDNQPRFTDCEDILNNGTTTPAVYTIWPHGAPAPFDVFCDFRGRSVVYTVIQSRTNGSLDFQCPWINYKNGFGVVEPYGNFWLGLDRVHYLTRQAQYRLHIDLVDFNLNVRYAEYASFSVGPEIDNYRLKLFYFDPQSTVDDTFSTYHNMLPFSTFDLDNDYLANTNCAAIHGGGWWYRDCDNVNLNGKYTMQPDLTGRDENGIEFDGFRQMYSLAATSMGLRRNFRPNVNFNH